MTRMNEYINVKKKIQLEIKPFLMMFEDRRAITDDQLLKDRVQLLQDSIAQNPEQFISRPCPEQELLGKMLTEIFNDFRNRKSRSL